MPYICMGRQFFDELVPFGSERNKCPLGLVVACLACRFYNAHEEKIDA